MTDDLQEKKQLNPLEKQKLILQCRKRFRIALANFSAKGQAYPILEEKKKTQLKLVK